MYSIIKLNEAMAHLFPHPQQPFDIIGRLIPRYDGGAWTTTEELFAQPYQKSYRDAPSDPRDYIGKDDQAVFLAMRDDECIGSIQVCKRWNGDGFIDDFKVDGAHRRKGVGRMLMDACVAWSKDNGLCGVSLETQANNLIACRFYLKYGFVLGGIDTKVYVEPGYKGDIALYFYLRGDQYLR